MEVLMSTGVRNEHGGWARRLRRTRASLRLGLLTAAAVGSSGCYSYFTAEPASLEQGEQIRVVLKDAAAQRLSPATRVTPETVEGNFEHLTEDSLAVAVWIGQAYVGTPFQDTHQTIFIARNEMQQVQQREISKWRTGITSGVALAAFAWGTRRIFYDPGRTPPPDGGTIIPPELPTGGARFDVPVSWILGVLW